MQRFKILGACLVAVCAMSAIAATAASAKRTWWVEEKQLAVGVTKGITGKIKAGTEAKLETEVGGKALVIKCKEAKLGSPSYIFNTEPTKGGGVTGWDSGFIEFSNCKTEPLSCTVNAGKPIRVPPVAESGESVLVESTVNKGAKGNPLYDDFLPEQTKSLFANFSLSGSLCPTSIMVKTELPIGRQGQVKEGEGGAAGEIEKAEENLKIHVLKFVCPPAVTKVFNWKGEEVAVNALKVGTASACFSVEAEVELVSKEPWDVR